MPLLVLEVALSGITVAGRARLIAMCAGHRPRKPECVVLANVGSAWLWRRIATAPGTRFDIEEVEISGERAMIRLRLRWGEDEAIRARHEPDARANGQIVEAFNSA